MKEKTLNSKKIAFIICTNDELYYDECVWYIEQIDVPEGYEIDIIAIQGAESIAEGYNAAMDSSDAKYKVYLHQDVFIYNREFIRDIIELFQKDEELGLLGVIGGVNLPQDAIIWNAWNRGSTYLCNRKRTTRLELYREQKRDYTEVEAIDGMLMVTQYDLPWREDLKLGWDFYDISQSLEFRRKGYKVGVPVQSEPWCLHDCGQVNLKYYDQMRKKVLKEYGDFFMGSFKAVYDVDVFAVEEQIFDRIRNYIEQGMLEQAVQIINMIDFDKITNNDLIYTWIMLDIYKREGLKPNERGCFFYGVDSWENAKNKFIIIGFMLRHVQNEISSEKTQELVAQIENGTISYLTVCDIAMHFTYDCKNVIRQLLGET